MLSTKSLCCQYFHKCIRNTLSNGLLHTEATQKKVQEIPSMMMRAWQLSSYGNLENMKLMSIQIPEIHNPSDVLVEVFASSINPIDLYMIDGFGRNLLDKMRQFDRISQGNCNSETSNLPLTLGRDFSGRVVATGQNVTDISVGDTVWGVVGVQNQGCHAEYTLTSRNNVCSIPKDVSNLEAASVPYVGLTCWNAVVDCGSIRPQRAHDKRVLILGAAGGLGSLATQMLNYWGAEVVGVCSESSFDFVRSLGGFELYDYKNSNTYEEILSDPRGFHLVVDAGGVANKKWMQVLRKHCGASLVSLRSPIPKNVEDNGLVFGITKSFVSIVQKNIGNLSDGRFYKWGNFTPNLSALEYLSRMVSDGKIKPTVAKVFNFEEAPAAYRYYSEGGINGKVVLDFSEKSAS